MCLVAAEGLKGESSQVELAGAGGWAELASLAVRVQLEGKAWWGLLRAQRGRCWGGLYHAGGL